MKKLLLSTCLMLVVCYSYGQDDAIKLMTDDTYNFKPADGEVIWQYTFKANLTAPQIIEYFMKHPSIKVDFSDSTFIKAHIERATITPRKYGISNMDAAMYTRFPMSAVISVEAKDGRYRLTASNVVFQSTMNIAFWGGVASNSNSQYTLTEMAYNLRRNKFKDMFFSAYAAHLIAGYFLDEFTIKNDRPADKDNW